MVAPGAAVAKTRGSTPLSADAALAPVDDVDAHQRMGDNRQRVSAGNVIAVHQSHLERQGRADLLHQAARRIPRDIRAAWTQAGKARG